ncbi:MAG: methyl-accepting chemotaxis protein [Spirochaetaceae bacterium]|jgi:methyl-accepting chemotaxis protein|nr:methyl-accepting chemotaxis protein [Spirochaetaceae bacterium]
MNFFNNLSIGKKFLCGTLFIAGIFTIISWQSIGTIIHCHHACRALLDGAFTTKSLAQSAQTEFYALTETANQSLFYAQLGDAAKSGSLQNKFMSDAQALNASLDKVLAALNGDPQVDKSIIAGLLAEAETAKNALNTEYVPLIQKLGDIRQYQENNRQLSADFTRTPEISQKIGASIDRVFKGIGDSAEGVYAAYLAYLMGIIFKLRVFIILTVGLSIAIALVLGLVLRKPLREAEQVARALAAMDFSVQIPADRTDEIGVIQQALIKIRDSLRQGIDDLNSHLAKATENGKRLNPVIAESSDALSVITGNMDTMQSETDTQMQSVAQTSNAVEEITKSIESLNHAVQTQAAHIVESSAAIEEMVANIDSIRSIVSGVMKTTDTLSKSSSAGHSMLIKLAEEIGRIREQSATLQNANKTIADIAGQTNILAMNAAIEAAHAGESGKGFAVVAGEIRKLAELSGKESNAISEEIQKIEQEIQRITEVSNETVESMDRMFTEIKAMDDSFAQVNHAVEEQASGGSEILIALKTIQDMTIQVRDGAGAIHQQSGSIHGEMTTLRRISQDVATRAYEVKTASGSIASFLEDTKYLAG